MAWNIDDNVLGNDKCTQFKNTSQNQLNPQNVYQYSPFITTNNTKTSQTITFSSFDKLSKTQSVYTKTLTATTTSNLPITFTSLDTSIATISGNILTAVSNGLVYIKATQDGDTTYDPANPVYCIFSIVIEKEQVAVLTYLTQPITVNVSTTKPNVGSFDIGIDEDTSQLLITLNLFSMLFINLS